MSTFIKMTEIYNGLSALFLFPAWLLVMVISSFSKELTVCICNAQEFWQKSSQVGWFCCLLFYTTDLIVYVLCIFMKEKKKFVQHLLLKKENMTNHPDFTQEDYPLNYGCIQFSPQFFSIGNFYL